MFFKFLFILFFFVFNSPAQSLFSLEYANLEKDIVQSKDGTKSALSFRQSSFAFPLPFMKKLNSGRISSRLKFDLGQMGLGDKDYRLYNISAPISILAKKKNFSSMTIFSPQYSGDLKKSSQKSYGASLISLLSKKKSENFSYSFGLAFFYQGRTSSFLPIAGLKYSWQRDWSFVLGFPKTMIQRKVNKDLNIAFIFRQLGTRWAVYDSVEVEHKLLKIQGRILGLELDYRLKKKWWLEFLLGTTSRFEIKGSVNNQDFDYASSGGLGAVVGLKRKFR